MCPVSSQEIPSGYLPVPSTGSEGSTKHVNEALSGLTHCQQWILETDAVGLGPWLCPYWLSELGSCPLTFPCAGWEASALGLWGTLHEHTDVQFLEKLSTCCSPAFLIFPSMFSEQMWQVLKLLGVGT